MKKISPFYSGLILIGFLLSVGLYFSDPSESLNDPGLGWHIKTGELVVASGRAPVSDPFLWRARPWIADQWLADCFIFKIYSYGGTKGLTLWLAVFFCATFLFLAPLIWYRGGGVVELASITLGAYLSYKLASVHFIVRPVVFSFLFFLVLNGILERGVRSATRVFAVGILFVLWANMHPSFVLGLILILIYLASLVVDRFTDGQSQKGTTEIALGMLFVSFCATLINPYGFSLHQSIAELGNSDYFMNLNQEWLPVTLRSSEGITLAFWFSVIIAGLFFWGRKSIGISTFEFFSLMIFSGASMYSIRYLPYGGIILAGALIKVIASGIRNISSRRLRSAICSLLVVFSIMGVVLPSANRGRTLRSEFARSSFSSDKFPVDAVDFIVNRTSSEVIVFNHPDIGGYLILKGKGLIRPVIDDRNTLNGEDHYREVLSVFQKKRNLTEAMAQYGAKYAIVSKGEFLDLPRIFTGRSFSVIEAPLGPNS